MSKSRGSWGSRLGFILAASGSAIGLGNIVFFSGNAYKYGGGAFYVPYLIALIVMGIPIMILELGLGRMTHKSLPNAFYEISGKKAEIAGWFGVMNASIITMYYIAILGWVVGMWVGSFGELWSVSSKSFFFDMISSSNTLVYVILVWVFNVLIIYWGTKSIESVVKIFVPLMWLMMIVLIVRGITLPNGIHGVFYLFTPDFSIMSDPTVWRGAFAQMFFTLSLGFGIMTAYASYLPKKSDDVQNASTISLMNCGFEFIAGVAIFSLLFTYAIVPSESAFAMMFFVVPSGIAEFQVLAQIFGTLFFTLLLLAGLTSSVSLVEAVVLSLIDKFRLERKKAIAGVAFIGLVGSLMFALPSLMDAEDVTKGTLGLELLGQFDHWAFQYGLMICGLLECIILGWLYDINKLREFINRNAKIKLGPWFNHFIRYVLPGIIILIIGSSVIQELVDVAKKFGDPTKSISGYYVFGFIGWLAFSLAGSYILTKWSRKKEETE